MTRPLVEQRDAIKAAMDAYVLKHYDAGEGYEDEDVKVTKVVSHRRMWNPDKLRKLVSAATFKNLVEVKVLPAKIDEYVRAGKLDRKRIEAAYEEVPNAPYVKVTSRTTKNGEEEATALADALG